VMIRAGDLFGDGVNNHSHSGPPGRIALAHNHPQADAVNALGWLGFQGVLPWVYALIWALKPTNVIDIRYMPEEERRATDAMIARLAGKAPSPPPPSSEPSG
jgi:hypothetical protein